MPFTDSSPVKNLIYPFKYFSVWLFTGHLNEKYINHFITRMSILNKVKKDKLYIPVYIIPHNGTDHNIPAFSRNNI